MGFEIKKTVNGETVWEPIKAKKYTASKTIEYTGALPITINANGQPLLDYLISGNTVQTGTPTPENPIVPSGCGERTENLFDKGNYNLIRANAGTAQNILYGDPSVSPYAVYIPVTGGETYSFYSQATLTSSCFTMETPALGVSTVLNGANTFGSDDVRTAPADAKYLVMFLELASVTQDRLDSDLATLTIVKSSTAPTSYIPYGYKLPLTLGSTTTDIYLGEVQSTRRVKKLVLTGEEPWVSNNGEFFYINVSSLEFRNTVSGVLCSHLPVILRNDFNRQPSIFWGRATIGDICLCVSSTTMAPSDFKSYLAAQYTNGTPVTVWYVLAEPETGIVNEPLMKIGDYADTISMEQAGVSIPTTAGTTVINYDGTLKPSQMYIKYNSWSGWSDIDNYKIVNGNWTQEMT